MKTAEASVAIADEARIRVNLDRQEAGIRSFFEVLSENWSGLTRRGTAANHGGAAKALPTRPERKLSANVVSVVPVGPQQRERTWYDVAIFGDENMKEKKRKAEVSQCQNAQPWSEISESATSAAVPKSAPWGTLPYHSSKLPPPHQLLQASKKQRMAYAPEAKSAPAIQFSASLGWNQVIRSVNTAPIMVP